MSPQAEKLREAGWRVLEGDGVFHVLPPGADAQHGWSRVLANAEGNMQLVKERSALHRQIAAVIA